MPSAGPRYSPGTMSRYQAAEDIDQFQWVHLVAPGTVGIARSDDVTTRKVIGAAFIGASQGGQILIIHHGDFPGFSGLSPTEDYFLQTDGFAGPAIPIRRPGGFILRLGYAKDDSTLHVQIGEPRIFK